MERKSYTGSDAVNHFISHLSDTWRNIKATAYKYPINMTLQDEKRFHSQRRRELCLHPINDKQKPQRHHDHSLPQRNYTGAYCTRCNLQCRDMRKYLTCLAHNMSFDVTIILKELRKSESNVEIQCKSETQLFKVVIGDLKFQDTLSIMNASLKQLAESHVASGHNTRYTHEMVHDLPDSVRGIVCEGKQVMCYEYLTTSTA